MTTVRLVHNDIPKIRRTVMTVRRSQGEGCVGESALRTAPWRDCYVLWLTLKRLRSGADYFQMVSRGTKVESGHMEGGYTSMKRKSTVVNPKESTIFIGSKR